ncbi:unnamed protein product [Diabrotica balteata]|uniref:Uncharacterized protein n=1 Tax=Diabrotica balteata TaxID=107213 RepID=A0A9N9XBK3_DIABA|nr:unnamed protein product [Diabrotica balteata]
MLRDDGLPQLINLYRNPIDPTLPHETVWFQQDGAAPHYALMFIFGLGLPIEVDRHAITLGSVFKAFYLLPTNASTYTQPAIGVVAKRSTSRWTFYEILENVIARPSSTTDELHYPTNMDYFSAEKLGKRQENCDYHYPGCKLNFLQQFSRFLK